MKRSKFGEAQGAFILKQAEEGLKQAEEGAPIAEVCRKAGIAEATFYNWRKHYGGMMPSECRSGIMLREMNRL
jgi:putative transposase